MKSKITIVVIFIVTIAIFFILPWEESQEVIWRKTFINTDKNPNGAYIVYSFLDDIFDGKVRSTRQTVYSNLENNKDDNYAYLFVNVDFEISEADSDYLIDFLSRGNNVFISAEMFRNDFLEEQLGISVVSNRNFNDSVFVMADYPEKEYYYTTVYDYFDADSCKFPYKVLADNRLGGIMFLKVKFNDGYLYLHSNPLVFANQNLLNIEKYDFAFRCLSYLPRNNNVIWDEFQKQGLPGDTSRFRVILASLPLRIALYLALISGLLYILFASKRVQRIIPEMKPPVNSSVEFLETLGNLYYRKRDYLTIARKRQAYFLDFIRKNYYLSTENIDDEFIMRLHEKSGVDLEIIKELFSGYRYLVETESNADSFTKYNKTLENFYFKTKNY